MGARFLYLGGAVCGLVFGADCGRSDLGLFVEPSSSDAATDQWSVGDAKPWGDTQSTSGDSASGEAWSPDLSAFDSDSALDTEVSVDSACKWGSFAPQATYHAGSNPGEMASADFNHDGFTDVVVLSTVSFQLSASLFTNQGDGTFGAQTVMNFPNSFGPQNVTAGDLNNDHFADIVFSTGSYVGIYRNNGDGTFPALPKPLIACPGLFVANGDVNGDGYADLVLSGSEPPTGSDTLSVLINQKDGTFASPATYLTDWGPFGVALADVNNDGHLDILVSTTF